jgi:hypothetical protein
MTSQRALGAGGLLLGLLALAGCGDGMAGVSGTVKLDDVPVQEGAIAFFPKDGKTRTTGGPIIDGHYSVRVPVGVMKVTITAPKVTGKKKLYNTPNSPWGLIRTETVPARYNQKSKLELDVQPGTNEKDFNLRSR